VTGTSKAAVVDDIASESPLALAVNGVHLVTTMRTPGHDLELAAGWLVAEAGVRAAADIVAMKALTAHPVRPDDVDTVQATLAEGLAAPEPRAVLSSSSCGVCSSRQGASAAMPGGPLHSPGWSVAARTLLDAPAAMLAQQRTFERTGGLHAAAIAAPGGAVTVVREDVGRHNAVDKVVGRCLLDDMLPLTDRLLLVSGRVSFEIVQKALAAGAAGIVAVSAPSSLAVDLAREHGMLLVGFSRGSSLNAYACPELIMDPV
jgi:FdhD protein